MSEAGRAQRSRGAGDCDSSAIPRPRAALRQRLFVGMLHILPQHTLSRLVFVAARVRTPWFKNLLTRAFLACFALDMSEALQSDPYRYATFNELFTRALKPGARPIAAGADLIVAPVDGTVSECGEIEGDRVLQAKGRTYTLDDLLARQSWASRFEGGAFATLYLAPHDYHRIHMPLDGRLLDTVYVPGRLFSVNAAAAQHVPRLFARNERVLTLFEGARGAFALVLVGALNVGSISTVWAGDITPAGRRRLTRVASPALELRKGEEMGRFNMGSTVILLLEPGHAQWLSTLRAGAPVRLGQGLGTLS
jgi:phosphatidylserine decarboxylase